MPGSINEVARIYRHASTVGKTDSLKG